MKKISGILFFTLLSFFGNAQIKKNTYLLGGQLSYINETYTFVNFTDQKRAGGTIGISIGKAFKENFVIARRRDGAVEVAIPFRRIAAVGADRRLALRQGQSRKDGRKKNRS